MQESEALNIQIEGGKKLSGEVRTSSSKNVAVALLFASLLNKGITTLKRVPKIEEVYRIIEIIESIGVKVEWSSGNLTIKPPPKLSLDKLDRDTAVRTRSIILAIAPLLGTSDNFSLPHPGGCKLGARSVKPHLYALENLGVDIETTETDYIISHKNLHKGDFVLYESGDTVTENVLMAAAQTKGTTTVRFASANYMVQEMCFFLTKLGVKIEGVGTTTLSITGLEEINENVEYTVGEDPIDSMFFIATAAITKSSFTISHCPIDFLELELLKLTKMGFKYEITSKHTSDNGFTKLVDIKTHPSTLTAPEDKIYGRPYPGLNIDNLPFFAIIATQANGQTLIHDWVYENRAIYYKELDKLGANTTLLDQHRLLVTGPTELKPAEVMCPPALRPGALILIGMLGAKGTSILRNIYSINRGYENIVTRLNNLGADISILK